MIELFWMGCGVAVFIAGIVVFGFVLEWTTPNSLRRTPQVSPDAKFEGAIKIATCCADEIQLTIAATSYLIREFNMTPEKTVADVIGAFSEITRETLEGKTE